MANKKNKETPAAVKAVQDMEQKKAERKEKAIAFAKTYGLQFGIQLLTTLAGAAVTAGFNTVIVPKLTNHNNK